MSWTDERVEQLRRLWAEGLSASQIASALGGVTRNAVIGKVHRLGLTGRARMTSQPSPARPKRPSRTPGFVQRPARTGRELVAQSSRNPLAEEGGEMLVAPEPLRLSLTQLSETTCKWPIGDPAGSDFHFCGAYSHPGSPYCAYHARLAYQPAAERRREKRLVNAD